MTNLNNIINVGIGLNPNLPQKEAQKQSRQPISLAAIGIRDNTSAMGT